MDAVSVKAPDILKVNTDVHADYRRILTREILKTELCALKR